MNETTRLEMFLAEIQKTGTSETVTSVHSVTVRLGSIEFSTIEALCRTSGLARNKVIVNLIQVAIEEMWKGLDPDMHNVIAGLQGIVLRELTHDEDGNLKALENAKQGEM